MQRKYRRSFFRRKAVRWSAGAFGIVCLALLIVASIAGFFDRDPIHLFGMDSARHPPLVAVYFSGDMGLRFGVGARVAPALAARGVPVYGVSSSTAFVGHRTQAQVDDMVADAVRQALARSGAERVIMFGQSFGSDILVAGLGALPEDLKTNVAAIVLVVPGISIYFRADPTGLAYRGAPDAIAATKVASLDWAPVICIHGKKETDSLCPLLGAHARSFALPGGHFLHNDHALLTATIFSALHSVLPNDQEQFE